MMMIKGLRFDTRLKKEEKKNNRLLEIQNNAGLIYMWTKKKLE